MPGKIPIQLPIKLERTSNHQCAATSLTPCHLVEMLVIGPPAAILVPVAPSVISISSGIAKMPSAMGINGMPSER